MGSEFFPVYALRIYYYISVQHIIRWYLEQSRTQYSPNEVKVAIRRTGILTNPEDLCMYCTLLQDWHVILCLWSLWNTLYVNKPLIFLITYHYISAPIYWSIELTKLVPGFVCKNQNYPSIKATLARGVPSSGQTWTVITSCRLVTNSRKSHWSWRISPSRGGQSSWSRMSSQESSISRKKNSVLMTSALSTLIIGFTGKVALTCR